MGSLASVYFKRETLEKIVETLKSKNEKGIEMTLSINDNTNDYGHNISAYVSQTKEQREAGKPKFYTGNGRVFWTDGKIQVADRRDQQTSQGSYQDTGDSSDLPF